MSVDTRDKRMAMIGLGSPVPRVLPNPDGGFSVEADRLMLLFLYPGFAIVVEPGCLEVSDAPAYLVTLSDAPVYSLDLSDMVVNAVALTDAPAYSVALADTPVYNLTISDEACLQ